MDLTVVIISAISLLIPPKWTSKLIDKVLKRTNDDETTNELYKEGKK